jgi:transposase
MLRREEVMEIMWLDRQGLSKRHISRKLGISRKTVSKYLARGGERSSYDTSSRGSLLGAYLDRIKAWLEEDDYRAKWMYDRLVAMGYEGGLRTVQRHVRRERGGPHSQGISAF